MTAPPTPRSAAHRRSLLAPSPKPFSVAAQLFKMPAPSAAQTSAWQTPTITRFLSNSQKGRTPGTLTRPTPLSFGPSSARAREDVGETSIVLEGSQTDMDSGENLLDDTIIDDPDLSGISGDGDVTILPSTTDLQDISTSPLANTRTLVAEEEQAGSLTESTQPAFVEPPLEPIPAVEEEPEPVVPDEPALSDEQTAILVSLSPVSKLDRATSVWELIKCRLLLCYRRPSCGHRSATSSDSPLWLHRRQTTSCLPRRLSTSRAEHTHGRCLS